MATQDLSTLEKLSKSIIQTPPDSQRRQDCTRPASPASIHGRLYKPMIDAFSRATAKNTVTGKNSLKLTLALQNRRTRDTPNPASGTHSASPEIADSSDGRSVDDGTDKRPRPFVFDVFAEDDEGFVNDG
jgi:hypothetical protein